MERVKKRTKPRTGFVPSGRGNAISEQDSGRNGKWGARAGVEEAFGEISSLLRN